MQYFKNLSGTDVKNKQERGKLGKVLGTPRSSTWGAGGRGRQVLSPSFASVSWHFPAPSAASHLYLQTYRKKSTPTHLDLIDLLLFNF